MCLSGFYVRGTLTVKGLTEFDFEYMIAFASEMHNMLASNLMEITRRKTKEVLDIDIHLDISLSKITRNLI